MARSTKNRVKPAVKLGWTGRTWEPSLAWPVSAGPAARVCERVAPAHVIDARCHRLILGDALEVARSLLQEGLAGKVDVVYLDPPFASQADYTSEARLDGPADGRVTKTKAYGDTWTAGAGGIGAYLDLLAPRLEAMTHLLAQTGTLWVHVDWRASYLVRVLLDEMLGRDRFINEIVWRRAPNLGRQAQSQQFGRTLDTLIVYGGPAATLNPPTRLEVIDKGAIRWDDAGRPFTTAPRGDYTDASIARLDAEGRVHRTASGRVYIKYFLTKNADGELCRERRVDALWTDIPPLRHVATTERTGYPTQKPRALLERIVACASPPGGLVVDLFAGSGTTGEAAHVLGRHAILGDVGGVSLSTARARMLRAGAALSVELCGDAKLSPGEPPSVIARRGDDGWKVTLDAPREPLAWAVDNAFVPGGPFNTAWHSSRSPGARPVHPQRETTLPVTEGLLAVRVFQDDGAVSTVIRGDRGDWSSTPS